MGKTKIIHIVKRFWPIGMILLLVILVSLPYITKGLIPFPSRYLVTFFAPWNASFGMPVKNNAMPDIITQIYPWKQLTINMWKQGQIPLWNPYAFGGTVHAGNYQTAVFSPINLLFFFIPYIHAWSIMILLQPLLSGIGTYLFLRSLNRSKIASCIGSIGFMLSGFITTWMEYGTLAYAALTLPWILWSVVRIFQKRSVIYKIILPFIVAFSLVSGHFQISLYVLMATIMFTLFEAWQKKKWNSGVEVLVYVLVGVGIAAPQLGLTYNAYIQSTRVTSYVQSEIIPWKYLITIFAPDFFGNPVTRNDWFGHYAEWASYIGVVPFYLAVLSIVLSVKGYKKYFVVLIGTVLALAFNTPISQLLFVFKIPIFSTSAASRIIFLLSFSLVCLSAFGLDELWNIWNTRISKKLLYTIIGLGVITIFLWINIYTTPFIPSEYIDIAKRNLILPTIFIVLTAAGILIGFIKSSCVHFLMVLLLFVLTFFDMYRFAAKWLPFEESAFIYPRTQSLQYLENNQNRIFGNIGGEVGNEFRIQLIEGYDAMYQARYGEFVNASSNGMISPAGRSVVQFDKNGRYKDELLQLMGVRYIYQRKSDGHNVWAFPVWQYANGEMVRRFEDEHYDIYEYMKAYPRVFLASSYEVITDNQQIINRLFSKDFNRLDTVVLEETPSIHPTVGAGNAIITTYSPTVVQIQTKSESDKLLFLSDTFSSGWEATVDGRKTIIHRANYDFRAIEVPSGEHIIEFRYHPIEFRFGIWVSVASILMLLLVIKMRK